MEGEGEERKRGEEGERRGVGRETRVGVNMGITELSSKFWI